MSKELRNFGLILAGLLAALAAMPFAPAWLAAHRPEAWGMAAVIAAVAVARPAWLAPLYGLFSRVGRALGWVNTRLLLGLVFFLLVLPIGFLRRLRGSPLTQGADPKAKSYRIPRVPDADPARFERPY